MAAFRVHKAYYVSHQDCVALAGRIESGKVAAGMRIDLPREVKGPGWVPISGVQTVQFADGKARLCVLIDYEVLTGAPLMEFADLEGLALDVRPGHG